MFHVKHYKPKEKEKKTMANTNKTTTVATTNNASALATSSLASFVPSNFGYYKKEFTKNDDGMTCMTVKTNEGVLTEKYVAMSKEDMASTEAMNELQLLNGVVNLATCFYASKLKNASEICGFKSVGDYIASNLSKYSPKTCNQYARVGELYLTADFDENTGKWSEVKWKRAWLEDVAISNLTQTLSLVKKCDNDIDKFYDEYIKTGKIHLTASQAKVKEEMSALANSDSKSDSSEKKAEKESKKPVTVTPETALSIINAHITANAEKLKKADVKAFELTLQAIRSIQTTLQYLSENK